MTGLEIIKGLWDAGKLAYEIATGLKKRKVQKLEKIAALYDHIGKLLHETYLELTKGQYPHGHCRQISIFANSIKNDFKDKLKGDADRLGDLLLTVYEVEQLHAEIGKTVSVKDLVKIDEASGDFIAASKLIGL